MNKFSTPGLHHELLIPDQQLRTIVYVCKQTPDYCATPINNSAVYLH